MSTDETKAIVRDVVEALNRRDRETLAAHPGLAETASTQPLVWAAFPDIRFAVEEQVAEGDLVASLVVARGTHGGPFMGVDATGRTVEYTILMLDRIEGGRIVHHRANPEWLAVLGPLGLLPPR